MKHEFKEVPCPQSIAEYYIEHNIDKLIKVHNTIWEYNERTHTWGVYDPATWVSLNLNRKATYPSSKNPKMKQVWKLKDTERFYHNMEKECERLLTAQIKTNNKFFENAPKGLMFKNKFVAIRGEQIKVEEPCQDHAALLRYDMDYHPVTVPPAKTDAFLKGFGGDEESKLLWEMIGTSLMGVATVRGLGGKALFVQGKTGSGKSTLINYICDLHDGKHMVIPASEFTPHGLDGLETKRVLYFHEINMATRWRAAYQEKLKQIITGDTITINPKNKKEYDVNPRALVIMAGNKLPDISQFDKALMDRLIFLKLPPTIKDIIIEYHKELEQEREQAICYAIHCVGEMLKRPLVEGEMSRYATPSSHQAAWEEVAVSDKTIRFFTECLEVAHFLEKENGRTNAPLTSQRSTKPRVYDYYKIWCSNENIKDDLTRRQFYKALYEWAGSQMDNNTHKGIQLKRWYRKGLTNGVLVPFPTKDSVVWPFLFKKNEQSTPTSADVLITGMAV